MSLTRDEPGTEPRGNGSPEDLIETRGFASLQFTTPFHPDPPLAFGLGYEGGFDARADRWERVTAGNA
jgi:hypothetical protein